MAWEGAAGGGERPNIMWISANGGNWEQLIRHENGLLGIPQMLPGGEAVMYLNQATSPYTIMVQSLKSAETKELLQGALFAQYVKTGAVDAGFIARAALPAKENPMMEVEAASATSMQPLTSILRAEPRCIIEGTPTGTVTRQKTRNGIAIQ